MQTYRATFQFASPLLTPWQADTFFGHLCWALARLEGEKALAELLTRCRQSDPPLLVSDGFPPDSLPRPLVPPPPPITAGTLPEQIALARQGKAARDGKWLTSAQFAQILQGQTPEQLNSSAPDREANAETPFATLHNQINRATGTTTGMDENDEAGQLYALTGENALSRVVYVRVADDIGFDWRALLHSLKESGFGKRKSVGYGAVAACEITLHAGFGEPENANGFVSLSAFVPHANDPTEGQWRADVKYGKLGEEHANLPNPFKSPLVRLLAGAVFRTDGSPRPFYGRLVDGIAPGMPTAAQYGFAFAVPLHLP